jgi:glycosyltransferase involved in cell wall biosynthesis
MADPTTILFVNNYDMQALRSDWRAGTAPAHHLWGTADLSDAFEVKDISHRPTGERSRRLEYLERRLSRSRYGGKFGDPDLQAQLWNARSDGSVVLAGNLNPTQSLALARRAKLYRLPMVGICHHVSDSPSLLRRLTLQGYDHLITFSSHVTARLVDAGIRHETITTLGWGPDLHFQGFAYRAPTTDNPPILSLGRSRRDLATLMEALAQTGHPARVYAASSAMVEGPVPDTITIVSEELPYRRVLDDLHGSALIAIPLFGDRSNGLTEMADAMASGRPVIATRTPFFDIDIEAIGCGWWVEKGDVRQWCSLLDLAMSDRARLAEMGLRGRRWAEQNWNADRFGNGVNEVLMKFRT